jgi:hypothetical protein
MFPPLTTGRRVDASRVSLGKIQAKESPGKRLPTSSHAPRRNAGIESALYWPRCGLGSRSQRKNEDQLVDGLRGTDKRDCADCSQ